MSSLGSHESYRPGGSHALKTKSPFAEEVPNLGVLFLESPKASSPGQTGHAHTPPLGLGSRGEDAKPTQKPGGQPWERRNPDISPAVLVLTGVAVGGGGLLCLLSGFGLRTIFHPFVSHWNCPYETLGDRQVLT